VLSALCVYPEKIFARDQAEPEPSLQADIIFESTDAVQKLIGRLAAQAGLDIKVHCHIMRHACGYYLVNQGYNTREIQDFLGHRDIKHTEKYTKLNARRFLNFDWGDL